MPRPRGHRQRAARRRRARGRARCRRRRSATTCCVLLRRTAPTTGWPRGSRCRPRRPCSRTRSELADYVVIDSPPLTEVIDALPLAQQVDDVVLVVRLGSSNLTQLAHLGDLLDQNGIRPVGFVVVGGPAPEERATTARRSAAAARSRDWLSTSSRARSSHRAARRRPRPSAERRPVTARAELPTRLLTAILLALACSSAWWRAQPAAGARADAGPRLPGDRDDEPDGRRLPVRAS